jgi:glycosyltransferase involved in cell wall biosynthesis/SAM-dependent methyltransferase
MNPQPSDERLSQFYCADYFLGDIQENWISVNQMKQATAALFLSDVCRYSGLEKGNLLDVGCGLVNLRVCAEREGWRVTEVDYSSFGCEGARTLLNKGTVHSGELRHVALPANQFDLCVLGDVMGHVRDPLHLLREVHRVLKPGGTLLVATPVIRSSSSKIMRRKWLELKPEQFTYFDGQTLQTALFRSGFAQVVIQTGWKILSLDFTKRHFERFPAFSLTSLISFCVSVLPRSVQPKHHKLAGSGVAVFAIKTTLPTPSTLSVIVPAFNEVKTFDLLMQALLHKSIPNLELEIIVVESNSTDGTRELALKYADHQRVKLILEDSPLGKGHAVRRGLMAASGQYVLIQDADLEYDLEDYDSLLEPLLAGRCAFVLGSRHGGTNTWKIRRFTQQPVLGTFLNLGHYIFATILNLLLFTRLRDPFTMFKVFRRDCLYGLEFKCNRFDFDIELLMKLVRKGYRPIELPVNYRSRSFKEGKKVRIFRDPLTWLKALIWLSFCRSDPMGFAERMHKRPQTNKNSTKVESMRSPVTNA